MTKQRFYQPLVIALLSLVLFSLSATVVLADGPNGPSPNAVPSDGWGLDINQAYISENGATIKVNYAARNLSPAPIHQVSVSVQVLGNTAQDQINRIEPDATKWGTFRLSPALPAPGTQIFVQVQMCVGDICGRPVVRQVSDRRDC